MNFHCDHKDAHKAHNDHAYEDGVFHHNAVHGGQDGHDGHDGHDGREGNDGQGGHGSHDGHTDHGVHHGSHGPDYKVDRGVVYMDHHDGGV